jgi:hypothetical protein
MLLRHAAALKVRAAGWHEPMHGYEGVLLLTKSPGTTSIDRHCASGQLMVARRPGAISGPSDQAARREITAPPSP